MRGRGSCCVVGNPGNAGANVGHPCGSVGPRRLEGKACGFQAASITIFIEVAVGLDAMAMASTASDKGKRCETSLLRS